jgi:hypothetical protein
MIPDRPGHRRNAKAQFLEDTPKAVENVLDKDRMKG